MTDSGDTPTESEAKNEDATGDDALDAVLAEPVLKGQQGIDKAQIGIIAFLIVMVGILAFSNTLNIGFIGDDQRLLVSNEALHSLVSVAEGWDGARLRPVTALSFAANWTLTGGNAEAFHFFNIAIHLANAVLVFLLSRRLLECKAPEAMTLLAGMLFAVHPAVTHSVNYISNRSVLLGTFFALLSVVLYLRATRDEERFHSRAFAVSLAAYVLAWASDASVVALPLVLVAIDFGLRGKGDTRSLLIRHAPFWSLAVAFVVADAASVGSVSGAAMLGQAGLTLDHLRYLAWPVGLSAAHAPVGAASVAGVVAWGILAVGSIALLRFAPVAGVALLWVALAIAAPGPASLEAAFREEHLYLPLAGLAMLAPWAMARIQPLPLRQILGVACVLLVLASIALTHTRNNIWRSEGALWENATARCPTCYEPVARLGQLNLYEAQRMLSSGSDLTAAERDQAQVFLQNADTMFSRAVNNLAEADAELWLEYSAAQRLLQDAEGERASLKKVLELNPDSFDAAMSLAAITEAAAVEAGDARGIRRSIDYYRRAEALGELSAEARVHYGNLLVSIGDLRDGERVLLGVGEGPFQQSAQSAIARARATNQQIQTLAASIDTLARTNPEDPTIVLSRGVQLLLQGRYLDSTYLLRDAFRNGRDTQDHWLLLGVNAAKMGVIAGFIDEWPDGYGKGDASALWVELARRSAASGAWGAARAIHEGPAAGSSTSPPLIALGDLAAELGVSSRAYDLYSQATQAYAEDPAPWMRLAAMALGTNQLEAARNFLVQAQRRGAAGEDFESMKRRADLRDTQPQDTRGLPRTIIR